MAENFNDYFVKNQPIINSFRSFLKQRCSASAFLDPVTDDKLI